MSLREIKARARRDLHRAMQVPAMYVDPKTRQASLCDVRVHYDFKALGDVKGTSFAFAERRDITPQIIFLREQGILPLRGGVISISAEEAYRVDTVDPPDGITVKAFAPAIPQNEITRDQYPTPDKSYAYLTRVTLPGLSAAVAAHVPVVGTLDAEFAGLTE